MNQHSVVHGNKRLASNPEGWVRLSYEFDNERFEFIKSTSNPTHIAEIQAKLFWASKMGVVVTVTPTNAL